MNIFVLCTVGIGIETLELIKNDIEVKGIIGLNSDYEYKEQVSGFFECEKYCKKNNIEFFGMSSYDLKDIQDIEKILSINIDILLVLGWQRLIPHWLIKHVKIACIGGHGSPWGIEKGRGRSPLNWSLILDKKIFYISIFKIDEGTDSGSVIDEEPFEINEYDDINSVYYKTSWLMAKMIVSNIDNGNIQQHSFKKQNEKEVRYLPKRTSQDGQIDWNRNSKEIYNFIRALTKPYPGAFTILGKEKIHIWKSIPFANMKGFEKYTVGQIIKCYSSNNHILVKTKDSALLVQEYTCEKELEVSIENSIFESVNFQEQIKNILKNHYDKYKGKKCNEEIESLTYLF